MRDGLPLAEGGDRGQRRGGGLGQAQRQTFGQEQGSRSRLSGRPADAHPLPRLHEALCACALSRPRYGGIPRRPITQCTPGRWTSTRRGTR